MAFFSSVVPVADNWVITHNPWDELEFPAMNGVGQPMKRGEYFRMYVDLEASHVGPNSWNFLKPSFVKAGWTVVKDPVPDTSTGVLHYTRGGKDSWLKVDIAGQRVEMLMIDVIPVPATLTLKLPDAVLLLASVTTTVKLKVPVAVGIPARLPFPFSAIPGGGVPAETLQR